MQTPPTRPQHSPDPPSPDGTTPAQSQREGLVGSGSEVVDHAALAQVEQGRGPPERPGRLRRLWRCLWGAIDWLFGAGALVLGLSVLATIPVLNLLSLGYLLEVSGRLARGGRLRHSVVGVRKASRVGSIVLGTWLLLLPLRIVSDLWDSARLIDPESEPTRNLRFLLILLTVLLIGQILWAWNRGGRLRHFFWPAPLRLVRWLRTRGKLATARDALWDFVMALRLGYYFSLGLRGFVGAIAWLAVPVLVMLAVQTVPAETPQGLLAVLSLVGGMLLALVVLYLPLLQAHFAAENRLRAMFELRAVRGIFRRAPVACWFALLVTLLFSIPLYLLKVELTPREVTWLPSLLFVIFIFPARVLTGWAVGRSKRRSAPRHFVFRWSSRLAALPVVVAYALIVYVTQYLSWYGPASLLEQHAFLVPVPFLSM